jgi:hypothetical protein
VSGVLTDRDEPGLLEGIDISPALISRTADFLLDEFPVLLVAGIAIIGVERGRWSFPNEVSRRVSPGSLSSVVALGS